MPAASDLDDDSPAVWQREFTVDNVVDYARASRDLSEYIRLLHGEGFKNLVIPSRGAMPFVRAAASADWLSARQQTTPEARLARRLEHIGSPFMRKLILPFSADPTEQTQTSAAIRDYWSRVLAAIVRRDGLDPYLRFYKVLVEKLARRQWLDALDRDLPDGRFIFVDTVISGRAICEILDAFARVGLSQCHFILIVDANGTKIEGAYRRMIEELVYADRCTLINVNRMFTEDRGPGASGVWSTVYPQVLDATRNAFPWARDCYGNGTFYHAVQSAQIDVESGIGRPEYNMPVTQMMASISGAIFAALQAMQQCADARANLQSTLRGYELPGFDDMVERHRSDIMEKMRASVQRQLQSMRETMDEFGRYTPLDKRTTKALAEPRVKAIHPNAEVDVSGSHLVRVTLPEGDVTELILEAKRELSKDDDVLADDWFR
jgi:hypothetical protein